MPSQLRLRAIAADAAPTARSRGRRSTHSDVGPATEEALDVMQSIQARIDELRREVPEYPSDPHERAEEGDADAVRGPKRARSGLVASPDAQLPVLVASAREMHAQPSNAIVDTRDGRTKIYIGGYELTEVPPLSRVKLTSLNFFQFHHVWTNPSMKGEYKTDRLIDWSHPSLLSLLRYGKISLFIDGTFRCVPRRFRQCIVVMVYDQGTKLYVPAFYVLGASETFDSYWNVLQYVGDACGQRIEPKQVVCDFEKALISAVGDWFPETDIVGCSFHFKQACSRKMAKLRIPPPQIKLAMEKGALDMLTVVDPAKIAKQGIRWATTRIKNTCDEEGIEYSTPRWAKFWKYFKKTWVTLLPPKVWNVHGLRRDVVARTNNPLERFNRELNAAFGTPHPSVVRFVQTIEEISRRYVKLRDDIARGIATPPKRDALPELPTPVELPDATRDDDNDSEGESGEEDDSGNEDDNADMESAHSDGGSDEEEVSV